MNFLQRIKAQLYDPRQGRVGMGQQVRVDSIALSELIDNFESLDSQFRASFKHHDLRAHLRDAITAMYHNQGRNSELTLLVIMETLTPLIEANEKRKAQGIPVFKAPSEHQL